MKILQRRLIVLSILAAALTGVLATPSVRTTALRAAGWMLLSTDPLEPADVIVIALDAGGEGALEAADLINKGISRRVAVFSDPPSGVDHEFLRRGLAYEDRAAITIRQLESLGVKNVERISRTVEGSEDESRVLPEWTSQNSISSVILVGTADHSRRLSRMLRRTMNGYRAKVRVRASRYSQFDPDRWWKTRGGIRVEIIEIQKLLLDVIRHPLS